MREKLISLRGERTVTEVARGLNITRQMLSAIENGGRTPSLELVRKIANYYATSIEDIFFDPKGN